MTEKRPFQTTTAAEFREIAKAARTGGRLPELIAAIQVRLDRHLAMLELHESARDIQQVRQTRRLISNLENKLEIARKLATAHDDDPE